MPICANTISPQRLRPGNSRWPGFLRKKVTVSTAGGAAPRISPVAPSTPLGTSTATTGSRRRPSASMTARGAPSTGRASPAPNIASIARPASPSASGASGSIGPVQRRAASAASPRKAARSPASATRTRQPRSARIRAATKPSPPLLPGPHSTASGRGGQRRATASATARPACSISTMPGTPEAIVSRSASPICCGVSSAHRRQPSSEIVIAEMWDAGRAPGSPALTLRARTATSNPGGGCSSVG